MKDFKIVNAKITFKSSSKAYSISFSRRN